MRMLLLLPLIFTTLSTGAQNQKNLRPGEKVLLGDQYLTVVKVSDLTITLKTAQGELLHNIRRAQLALTSGCHQRICVNQQVMALTTGNSVKVLGLTFDNKFITSSMQGGAGVSMNVGPQELALTQGCLNYARNLRICTGNFVRGIISKDYQVVGLQSNGKVVLRSEDARRTIKINVAPESLIIMR